MKTTIGKNSYEKAFIFLMLLLFLFFAVLFVIDNSGNQLSQYFLKTDNMMADYYNVCIYSAERDPYCFGQTDVSAVEHAYPPLAYLVFYGLSRTADYSGMDTEAFSTSIGLLTAMLFLFFSAALLWLLIYEAYDGKKVFKFLISLSLFLSGVFFFSWERGNLALLTTALTTIFVMFYDHENKYLRELSYIALALAAAMKVFPALLGVLLLFDKRWKDSIRLVVYGAVAFFLPFAFFKGGFANVPVLIDNVIVSTKAYGEYVFPRFGFREFTQYSEYYADKKPVFSKFLEQKWLFNLLNTVANALCALALVTSVAQKTKWKVMTQLMLTMVVFPVNSSRYSALYLFVAVAMFLSENVERGRFDSVYLFLFVFIFNPFRIGREGIASDWLSAGAAYLMLTILTVSSTVLTVRALKADIATRKQKKAAVSNRGSAA